MENLFKELEKWSNKYDINFQFWHRNNSVYINKSGHNDLMVDLYSTGGYDTPKEVIIAALDWIYKVNRVPLQNRLTSKK